MKYLLLSLLLVPGLSYAGDSINADEHRFQITRDKGDSPDTNRKWSAGSIARNVNTVTAGLAFAGEGLVDGVCGSSGTAINSYIVLLDTDVITAATGANASTQTIHRQYSAGVPVAQPAAYAAWSGCQDFATPIPFKQGLGFVASDTGGVFYIRYRKLRLP